MICSNRKSNQITYFQIKYSSGEIKSPHLIQSRFKSNRYLDLPITVRHHFVRVSYYSAYNQACSQKCEIGGGGQMMKVEGQQVERRRIEAPKAPSGVGFPMGRGLWRELCPSPENFLSFCIGMLHFGCNLMHFQT